MKATHVIHDIVHVVHVVIGWLVLMIALPWGLALFLYHCLAHIAGLPCFL